MQQPRDEPLSFRARSLGVSLTVKDLDTSIAWYCDVVGFHLDRRIERDGQLRGAVILAGDVRMILNRDDGAKGWDRVKGEGFSMNFVTALSVDDVAERIESHGGTLESQPADMPWGVRSFRVRDPDGYRIAVSQPLAK
jgi:lactoylglutathione lyase